MKSSASRFSGLSWLLAFVFLLGATSVRAQTASQLYAQGLTAYEQGNVELAKTKLQQTLRADRNFRPASALLSRITQEQQPTGAAAANGPVPVTRRTLDQLVVPVEFKDTPLQSAVEYLRQQIEHLTNGRTQANFVLNVPPETANKRVTLQMNRVPVTALLDYVGNLAGVNFSIEKYAIVVTPAGGNPATPATTP